VATKTNTRSGSLGGRRRRSSIAHSTAVRVGTASAVAVARAGWQPEEAPEAVTGGERMECVWEGTRSRLGLWLWPLGMGGGGAKVAAGGWWSGLVPGGAEDKERRRHEGDHTTEGLLEFLFLIFIN
jgi:hypothetical protein